MFELPKLLFSYDDFEPYVDAETMEIHYSKHHNAYVTNLNNALKDFPEIMESTLEDLLINLDSLPEQIKMIIRNNAGGHFNHSFFWKQLKMNDSKMIPEKLNSLFTNTFGGYSHFEEAFKKSAMSLFGSGWTFLLKGTNDKLEIKNYPNQNNPIMEGLKPIFGVDVWEHAYYLKFQNRRAEYLENIFKIINWEVVEENYS